MAIVYDITVGTADHLYNLLEYVKNHNKTADQELVTCHGCQIDTAYNDFNLVRKMHNNEKGLVAHQFIHSFKIGETTAEKAHAMSIKLAQQAFPGFQYNISTHIDKEHIHSHIVINSVSYITGNKYNGNKESLAVVRDISDKICLKNGLSIIEDISGYRSLDKSTYELAKKGKSWKLQLAADIDNVLVDGQTKEGFITALEGKGYQVEWKNVHIVVHTKDGKKIRVDTLAKQLGSKYKKANIEHALGLRAERDNTKPIIPAAPKHENSEWGKLEKKFAKAPQQRGVKIKTLPATGKKYSVRVAGDNSEGELDRLLAADLRTKEIKVKARTALSAEFFAKASGKSLPRKMANVHLFNSLIQDHEVRREFELSKKRMEDIAKYPNKRDTFGNLSYRRLLSVPGEVETITIRPEEKEVLQNLGIFYSGIAFRDNLLVSFKSVNLGKVMEALPNAKTLKEERFERDSKTELRTINKKMEEDYHKIICSADDLRKLEANNIKFAFSRDGEEYTTLILSSDVQKSCEVLQKDFKNEQIMLNKKRNMRLYAQMKTTAKIESQDIAYITITGEQYKRLRDNGVSVPVFKKGEKFNVAYLKSQDKEIKEAIYTLSWKKSHKR